LLKSKTLSVPSRTGKPTARWEYPLHLPCTSNPTPEKIVQQPLAKNSGVCSGSVPAASPDRPLHLHCRHLAALPRTGGLGQ
jgi:hypothetical protein